MQIPRATYRLQFRPNFTFDDAQNIADYLAKLNISTLYASPIFQAVKGSTHGYDWTNPLCVNDELGGRVGFDKLYACLKKLGVGWLQDIVPNHSAYSGDNIFLRDIFKYGKDSEFYNDLDIYWDDGKIIAPFLTKPYDECLHNGDICLGFDNLGFTINYKDLSFPICETDYSELLKESDLLTAYYSGILTQVYKNNSEVRVTIDKRIEEYNSDKQLLDELISRQIYNLCACDIVPNYRRFFDIDQMICIRQEDSDVMDFTHNLVYQMVDDGKIDGLRIDHIDGLKFPAEYLMRLNEKTNIYTVVEKILGQNEVLSLEWQCQGTTGYEFLNISNRLFCDGDNETRFTEIYKGFSGITDDVKTLHIEKKKFVLDNSIRADVEHLLGLLQKCGGEFTPLRLTEAIKAIMIALPVYRTYIDKYWINETDKKVIFRTIDTAVQANPDLKPEIDFLQDMFLLTNDTKAAKKFVFVFQQMTSPVMAKSLEDTLFYIYNRLLSLNEVGGEITDFAVLPDEFHEFNLRQQRYFPHNMNATSTHDTKRGEDIRYRINVLSELPNEWADHLKTWHELNTTAKPSPNDEYFIYQTLLGATPFDKTEEPNFVERMKAYFIKSAREAKISTSWYNPNSDYEKTLVDFVDTSMSNKDFIADFSEFQQKIAYYGMLNSLATTLLKITVPGLPDFYQGDELWNLSLVDPDNRRPVDFDIRRAYLDDIVKRENSDTIGLLNDLLDNYADGKIKLYLIYRSLALRNTLPDLFTYGNYIPLDVQGKHKSHIIAFARQHNEYSTTQFTITIVPRLLTSIVDTNHFPLGSDVWEDTAVIIPDELKGLCQNVLDYGDIEVDGKVYVGDVLKDFPVGLLAHE